jgi:hypothetical protein
VNRLPPRDLARIPRRDPSIALVQGIKDRVERLIRDRRVSHRWEV